MKACQSKVLLDYPDFGFAEAWMEFRLVYQGTLLVDNPRGGVIAARANHKHEIRKAFHPQLKRLWGIHPYLRKGQVDHVNKGPRVGIELGAPRSENTIPRLAERFARFGYNFVPLVTRDMEVVCSVEVLFLRNDPPGSLFSAGDIDNRLKTLFDGLLIPRELNQVGRYTAPSDDEQPFFCLLEDDSLITKVSVETDTLLAPTSEPPSASDARVILKVSIRPYAMRADTLGLG